MRTTTLVAVVALLVAAGGIAQPKKSLMSFELLFPPAQQPKMGLHKLTTTEKEALRTHVAGLLVLAMSNTRARGGPGTAAQGRLYAGVGGGHWIKENIDRGTLILLEDGSLWKIDPMDKLDAMLWLPYSDITVARSSTGTPGYDYLLVNTDDNERAHAKYMGGK